MARPITGKLGEQERRGQGCGVWGSAPVQAVRVCLSLAPAFPTERGSTCAPVASLSIAAPRSLCRPPHSLPCPDPPLCRPRSPWPPAQHLSPQRLLVCYCYALFPPRLCSRFQYFSILTRCWQSPPVGRLVRANYSVSLLPTTQFVLADDTAGCGR